MGIGQGPMPAEPATEDYRNHKGFKLLVKCMSLRIRRVAGDYDPAENAEDYMQQLIEVNTPVINAAVGWKSAAEKRFRKFNRPRFGRNSAAEDAPLQWRFTMGSTEGEDFTPSRPVEIYAADGRQQDDDEGEDAREEPCMMTAFDATVWDLLEEKKQATTEELRRTMEQAADVPVPVSAVDVPVPAGNSDAEL